MVAGGGRDAFLPAGGAFGVGAVFYWEFGRWGDWEVTVENGAFAGDGVVLACLDLDVVSPANSMARLLGAAFPGSVLWS